MGGTFSGTKSIAKICVAKNVVTKMKAAVRQTDLILK
jgi:hypothetical protein